MANQVSLVVKGSHESAWRAVKAHGLKPLSIREFGGHTGQFAIIAESHGYASVTDWFAAPPFNAPYPDGTLLFYNVITEKSAP